ncbi:MAG: CdaR family protein [bacterium]|nr:CdaR family protein [bacterium]
MTTRSPLTRFFVHNYKIKLFCLLSALFFWFYISLENAYEFTVDVPVRVEHAPPGWILLHPLPAEVRVLFKGTGRQFVSYRFRERRLELDLRKVPNNTAVRLDPDMIKDLPAGIRVLSILQPETVDVKWDRLAERRVPVRSRLEFLPADGFTAVGDVRFDPDTVLISGPQSVVDSTQEVWTEARSFAGLVKEVRDRVPLAVDPLTRVRVSSGSVRFAADVQRIGERMIEGIPVTVINGPEDRRLTVTPATLALRVQGGVGLLGGLTSGDIQAIVDYRARERYGPKRLPARILIPRDVTFSEVIPQYFEVSEQP